MGQQSTAMPKPAAREVEAQSPYRAACSSRISSCSSRAHALLDRPFLLFQSLELSVLCLELIFLLVPQALHLILPRRPAVLGLVVAPGLRRIDNHVLLDHHCLLHALCGLNLDLSLDLRDHIHHDLVRVGLELRPANGPPLSLLPATSPTATDGLEALW